ncbi:MAG: divalent-cation tolerance protein CutA [Pseudomonadota bacterium]
MSKQTEHLLVLSTCPGSISAKNIAKFLVDENLAACVNIVSDVQSYFRWLKKVDTAEEYLLLIKTTVERYPDLEKNLLDMHPNELPEIIAVPIHTGLKGYLDWVSDNTR